MEKKFCIFDMDGTLVDSMGYWRSLGREFLQSKGVPEPLIDQTLQRVKSLTMAQAVQLFQDEFGMAGGQQALVEEMNAIMEEHYRRDVEKKPGIEDFLTKLKVRGCHMCVATATHQRLAELCLHRLGLDKFFEFLLSCEKVGVGKGQPDIYLQAARRLDGQPEEIAVFEDVLYAARTAKGAGFYTVEVQDDYAAHEWEELTALADEVITNWSDVE